MLFLTIFSRFNKVFRAKKSKKLVLGVGNETPKKRKKKVSKKIEGNEAK